MTKYIKNIFLGFFIISSVILIHEFGHLVVGLLLNQNPESFSLGFGPKLLSYNLYNIDWDLRMIPLGGFVSFPAETMSNNSIDLIYTIIAGPLMNFLFSFLLYLSFFYKIREKVELHVINEESILVDLKYFNLDSYIYNINTKKRTKVNNIEMIYSNKIKLNNPVYSSFISVFVYYFLNSLLFDSFRSSYKMKSGIIGPIGIVKHGIKEYDKHMLSFLLYMANLSVSIGILNLIPVPFFDGGKLMQILMANLGYYFFIIFPIIFMLFFLIKKRFEIYLNKKAPVILTEA